mmetsp:Transcript_2360/g.8414  ORF Transcript_2360/g.8414 Transcript_2360/m.8414 type:complete len:206 (+) Transcript_2360:1593-2210(+)
MTIPTVRSHSSKQVCKSCSRIASVPSLSFFSAASTSSKESKFSNLIFTDFSSALSFFFFFLKFSTVVVVFIFAAIFAAAAAAAAAFAFANSFSFAFASSSSKLPPNSTMLSTTSCGQSSPTLGSSMYPFGLPTFIGLPHTSTLSNLKAICAISKHLNSTNPNEPCESMMTFTTGFPATSRSHSFGATFFKIALNTSAKMFGVTTP